jgi:hypothetical protein
VELRPWDLFGSIKWEPAKDFKAQEKVIERLLSIRWEFNQIWIGQFKPLKQISDENEIKAFLFAASEYERIARETTDLGLAMELAAKATIIRGLVKE